MTYSPVPPTQVRSALPEKMGTFRTLTANINKPVTLDQYLDAFYSTWSLRLEQWVGKRAGHETHFRPGVEAIGINHRNILFPEVYKSGNTAAMWWCLEPDAGTQVFTVNLKNDGGSEIVFSCGEMESDHLMFKLLTPFHVFYMRFLFNHAVKRLNKST